MADRPSLWNSLLSAEVRFVTGRKYRHRVIEAGGGEPLLLVHGVGSSAEVFARNVMPLAQRFHVYAIDALYHGYGSALPATSCLRGKLRSEGSHRLMIAD
ncbi:MAG TPA: alpha/beta fold hydrolase, partial [Dehalococcoidia bacterium]|nr:alpha/beta fold hydrolase [Dehalococcoidia bacterium]